jgi:hypothetical protein
MIFVLTIDARTRRIGRWRSRRKGSVGVLEYWSRRVLCQTVHRAGKNVVGDFGPLVIRECGMPLAKVTGLVFV